MAITKMRFYCPNWHHQLTAWLSIPKTAFALERASRTAGPPETSSRVRHGLIVWLCGSSPRGCGGAALCRQIVEPFGQLVELPCSRQRSRLVPGRLLPAEPRQWRLAVHGGDRSEQSQILRLRRKATRLKSVLQRAVCPQYLCCSRCSQSRDPRQLVRRVAKIGRAHV